MKHILDGSKTAEIPSEPHGRCKVVIWNRARWTGGWGHNPSQIRGKCCTYLLKEGLGPILGTSILGHRGGVRESLREFIGSSLFSGLDLDVSLFWLLLIGLFGFCMIF